MQFYVLAEPRAQDSDVRTDFVDADHRGKLVWKLGAAPTCPVCGGAIGKMPVLPPRQVKLGLWGRLFSDLAFGGSADVLVSARFRDAFLRSGLTGFSGFAPVVITNVVARLGKIPKPLPSYFQAVPARS